MTSAASSPTFSLPPVPLWRINVLRAMFLVLALVMGGMIWSQILFHSAEWVPYKGVAKSMLAALALVGLLGVRYPLQMLPLMIYEVAWKTIWLTLIAARAWYGHRWTPEMAGLFRDCVGIVLVYPFIPWRYAWARYVAHPAEAWRAD